VKIDSAARTTSAFDAANQLRRAQDVTGITTFTFDASGNQQLEKSPAGARTTNTWDYENKLTKVALPSGILNTFLYNGDGQRVSKAESTGTLKAIWDGQKILAEATSGDIVTAVYTSSPGLYGDLISQRRVAGTSYYHFDPLGSTDRLTNATQTVTASYLYKAFGEIVTKVGATINPWQFVGAPGYYASDDASGQYAVRARVLRAFIGRMLSPDTGLRAFISGYQYADNMPLSRPKWLAAAGSNSVRKAGELSKRSWDL